MESQKPGDRSSVTMSWGPKHCLKRWRVARDVARWEDGECVREKSRVLKTRWSRHKTFKHVSHTAENQAVLLRLD